MEEPAKLHRMVSHQESGIHEEVNRDGHADPWHLALLDTHDYSCGVLLWRLILFAGLYIVAGFYITFSNQGSSVNDYWGVGLGALCAYALVFSLMAVEAFVVHPWYYNKLKGQVGLPMVHWFTWTVFIDMIYMFVHPGFKGDTRITEYAGKIGDPLEETSADGGDLWMDFCADVGDGFNPTYAVFSSMSRAVIQVGQHKLPRPHITLVGGDIAYPWPRYEDVMARFIRPLAWSFPSGHGHDDTGSNKYSSLYVLPGNHEYMDGLRNFRALVLKRDTVGMYRVKNKTPYFAIHLPKHSYWIFCVDMGSDEVQDMDDFQISYFTEIIKTKTRPTDNFMCILHEPDWIKNGAIGFNLFAKFAHFRRDVLGDRLRMTVAGDIHHYRRMEEAQVPGSRPLGTVASQDTSGVATYCRQLVVAGNGGAFSHPTDVPHVSSLRLGEPHIKDGPLYVNKKCHPSEEESRDIFNNRFCLGFSFGKNYGFGSIVGLLYMGMMLSVSPNDYSPGSNAFPNGLQAIDNAQYLLRTITSLWFYPPFLWLLIQNIIIGAASQHKTSYANAVLIVSIAILHTALHVAFCFIARKFVDAAWAQALSASAGYTVISLANTTLFCFLGNVSLFAVGYWMGTYITIGILWFMTKFFNYYNEGWSTIENQDHKGFLRFRFTPEGDVEMFTLGIKKTPRSWKQVSMGETTDEYPALFRPSDMPAMEIQLIDHVLVKSFLEV